jgi:membrane-associated phospholipid phosphatase
MAEAARALTARFASILPGMAAPGNGERAAIGMLVALVSTVIVLLGIAFLVDHAVAASVAYWRAPVLDLVVRIVNPLGSGVTLLIVCTALAVVMRWLRQPRLHDAGAVAAFAFASSGLVEYALKHVVARPRPESTLFPPGIDSFPSGHATSVFAVATVFASYYPALRLPLYTVAAAIALGRVYLERHYVSDIVAGAALGFVFAVWLYRRRASLPRMMLQPDRLR